MYTQTRKELSHLVRRLIFLSPLVPKMAKNKKNAGLGCRLPARPRPPARARAAKARVPEKYALAGVRGLLLTTFPAPCCLLGRHDISAASSTIGRGVEVIGTAVVICVIA